MTLGVRAIVENERGEILLVRHTYVKGLYLPGGGVEKAEPCHLALQRELQEEGGIDLIGPSKMIGIYSNHNVFPNDHVVLYHVLNGSWAPCATDNAGEISELVWVRPDEAGADLSGGTKRRLDEVYKLAPITDHW